MEIVEDLLEFGMMVNNFVIEGVFRIDGVVGTVVEHFGLRI